MFYANCWYLPGLLNDKILEGDKGIMVEVCYPAMMFSGTPDPWKLSRTARAIRGHEDDHGVE